MTSTQTTKTNHYFRILVALAVLAMVASMLVASAARPAYAGGTYIVNSTGNQEDANPFDPLCDVDLSTPGDQCTLQAAFVNANLQSGLDLIEFDIPGDGVHTIRPTSTLGASSVVIDGYSQPGASANTSANIDNAQIKIELDGSAAGAGADGLHLGGGSVVKGLAINNYGGNGVVIQSGSNSHVEGNFIGTDASGTKAKPNTQSGVLVKRSFPNDAVTNNIIGGGLPAARNLLSGNFGAGVELRESSNIVVGNFIGTDRNANKGLGNTSGVFVGNGASNSTIGSKTSASANTIRSNSAGVAVIGDGVGNNINQNHIVDNVGMGIDLGFDGVTDNDTGDADDGPNDLQNKPVLTSAKTGTNETVVVGKLNSIPNRTYTIRFYSNAGTAGSGTGEGGILLGEKTVTTNDLANASFSFNTGQKFSTFINITATATDASGSTSEFSTPRPVTIDTVAPKVNEVSPAENATGVAPNSNVTAAFSEAMLADSVNSNTVKIRKAGTSTNLPAKVTYAASAKKATLDPSADLELGTTYVVKVDTGAKDLAGNALDQDPAKTGNQPKAWFFTVKP